MKLNLQLEFFKYDIIEYSTTKTMYTYVTFQHTVVIISISIVGHRRVTRVGACAGWGRGRLVVPINMGSACCSRDELPMKEILYGSVGRDYAAPISTIYNKVYIM